MIQTYKDIFIGLKVHELLVLGVFAVLFLIRFIQQFLVTGRILFIRKKTPHQSAENAISLIISVRNEDNNLREKLPALLSIENVNYEVVVVDDFSQDDTFLVLGSLKKEYSRLKISSLNEETRYSMKLSQNIALKAATNDWVLSVPVLFENNENLWLQGFISEMDASKNIIIGYTSNKFSGGFSNALFQIENNFLFLKSTGYILNRLPFVYFDENVAFRKSEYFKIGGYSQKIREPFANLELILNLFIRKENTTFLYTNETSLQKPIQASWKDYLELLKKSFRIEWHLSATKKAILAFDESTKLLFLPVTAVAIVLFPESWILFSALLFIKLTSYLFIIKSAQNRLNERKIFISSLVYDLLMNYFKFFYRMYFNRVNRKNKWRSNI